MKSASDVGGQELSFQMWLGLGVDRLPYFVCNIHIYICLTDTNLVSHAIDTMVPLTFTGISATSHSGVSRGRRQQRQTRLGTLTECGSYDSPSCEWHSMKRPSVCLRTPPDSQGRVSNNCQGNDFLHLALSVTGNSSQPRPPTLWKYIPGGAVTECGYFEFVISIRTFAHHSSRSLLITDDKIIVSWSGVLINNSP